jgi:hypothetical protein
VWGGGGLVLGHRKSRSVAGARAHTASPTAFSAPHPPLHRAAPVKGRFVIATYAIPDSPVDGPVLPWGTARTRSPSGNGATQFPGPTSPHLVVAAACSQDIHVTIGVNVHRKHVLATRGGAGDGGPGAEGDGGEAGAGQEPQHNHQNHHEASIPEAGGRHWSVAPTAPRLPTHQTHTIKPLDD